MVNKILSKELMSLVHHIELNEAGWWDKSAQQLILASISFSTKPQTIDDISTNLYTDYSVSLSSEKLDELIHKMCSSNILIKIQNKFKVSEESLIELDNKIRDTDEMENRIEKRFSEILQSNDLQVDPIKTWHSFKENFLIPLVHEMGAKTYEIISGSSVEYQKAKSFQEYVSNYPPQIQDALKDSIITFLDPKNPDVRSCVIQYLNAYFMLEAYNLPEDNINTLNDLNQNPPSFTVFVDTNFLFSILELHENPSNEAAKLLMDLIKKTSERISVKLKVLPTTIDEAKRTISYYNYSLSDLRMTPRLSKVAANKTAKLSGFALRFAQVNKAANYTISADEYFKPYLENLIQVLESKNVEFCDHNVDNYKVDSRVVDDIFTQKELQEIKFGKHSKRLKSYDALEHDILMWYFVNDHRPQRVESPLSAKYWIVTVDYRFLGFDAFKRRNISNEIPICIHPTLFIHMLHFWLPRTQEFEEAVLSSLRPLISQAFDPETEKMTIKILSALSRFEKVDDIPQEMISNVLVNKALRQRMSSESDINMQIELVKETIIDETTKITEQLESTEKEKELLNEKVKKLQNDLDESGENQSELEKRLNCMEETAKYRRKFAKKWFTTTIILIAFGFLIIYFISELSKIIILFMALLILWVWSTNKYGSENPIIKEKSLFKSFHKMYKWIISIFGLIIVSIIATLIATLIVSAWQ